VFGAGLVDPSADDACEVGGEPHLGCKERWTLAMTRERSAGAYRDEMAETEPREVSLACATDTRLTPSP
jgi:hypothetical protein